MVHDVTLRIISMNWIVRELDVDQMNAETAFWKMFSKKMQRIHMKCSPGMDLKKDECLKIGKGMCGLVQSVRVHWSK